MTSPSIDHYLQLVQSATPILDVRAPCEFASGHLPGASNAPLLTDDERHHVGLTYRKHGQNAAIALGEEMVSGAVRLRRVDAWHQFACDHPNSVLCCFRGGLRSQIAQQWLLDTKGIDLPIINGGYKAVRRFLIKETERICSQSKFYLLGGYTGSGKTTMLRGINNAVDLEGLANHRGSAFGRMPGGQPSQASFENSLATAFLNTSGTNPNASNTQDAIVLEHEGSTIGSLTLPVCLRQTMAVAPIVVVERPLEQRITQIRCDYIADLHTHCLDITADEDEAFKLLRDHLTSSAHRIRKRLGVARHNELLSRLDRALSTHETTTDFEAHDAWIEMVLVEYYDPMYAHQLDTQAERIVFTGPPDDVIDWLNVH